jgi:hypothetical protein
MMTTPATTIHRKPPSVTVHLHLRPQFCKTRGSFEREVSKS